jgi:hypothetical protein
MLMDVLMLLRNEEKKLLAVSNKIGMKLSQIRAAIHALSGNSSKPHTSRGNKLRGRKLSAAHRRAIKVGIAKAKARKAGSK